MAESWRTSSPGTWRSGSRIVRQLSYVEPGVVPWEDAPEPELTDPEAVLVRPLAVARCDLDVAMATFGLFPGPYPVGHEAVAEVVRTGASVSVWEPGDRVLVPFQVLAAGARPVRAAGSQPASATAPRRARRSGSAHQVAGTAELFPTCSSCRRLIICSWPLRPACPIPSHARCRTTSSTHTAAFHQERSPPKVRKCWSSAERRRR
jgi:Alcohol dehydrogenase GroES-like domain